MNRNGRGWSAGPGGVSKFLVQFTPTVKNSPLQSSLPAGRQAELACAELVSVFQDLSHNIHYAEGNYFKKVIQGHNYNVLKFASHINQRKCVQLAEKLLVPDILERTLQPFWVVADETTSGGVDIIYVQFRVQATQSVENLCNWF